MTTYNASCKLAFGRPSKRTQCPRCEELKQGAAPRKWAISERKQDEAKLSRAIRNHNCQALGCGPVCTAFDW